MMNYFRNDKGIALVMVLVLSLITLSLVTALIFMVTQGTTMSGAHRLFRTADEASVGGAELAADYMRNRGVEPNFYLFATGCDCKDPYNPNDNVESSDGITRTCRCDKLCNSTVDWTLCDENAAINVPLVQVSMDPTIGNNMSFTFAMAPNDFDVYAKIVDTVQGNSDVGGIVPPGGGQLGGAGVVASNSGLITPPHSPYLYRVEVLAQRPGFCSTTTATTCDEDADCPAGEVCLIRERSGVSLVYAY